MEVFLACTEAEEVQDVYLDQELPNSKKLLAVLQDCHTADLDELLHSVAWSSLQWSPAWGAPPPAFVCMRFPPANREFGVDTG